MAVQTKLSTAGMASSRTIRLLRASGVLGSALAETLGVRLAGRTCLRHPVEGGIAFDARTASIRALVERLPARPAAALVLVGETRIDACAADPRGTSEINVAGVVRVVGELASLGIIPVFVSSDAVFDGQRAHSTEDAQPRPILTSGRQKLEVERFMAAIPPPWIVVRLPNLLSPMLDDCIRGLAKRASIASATDQYFTPMRAADAAAALIALVDQQGAQGLYHLAGPERLSRRALLEAVIEEYRKHAP